MSKDDMWPEKPVKPKNLTEQYNFMEMLRQKSKQLDSATTSYITQQMLYIQAQGLDPRDYEVILCSDEFPKYTDDGLKITQRIRLVKKMEQPVESKQESDLDKKVELLVSYAYDVGTNDSELLKREQVVVPRTAKKIKQAFIDDGWSKVDKCQYRGSKGRSYQQFTFNGGYVRVPEFEVMTGQEWYDKFMSDLWTPPYIETLKAEDVSGEACYRMFRVSGQRFMHRRAVEAAKKASGIK